MKIRKDVKSTHEFIVKVNLLLATLRFLALELWNAPEARSLIWVNWWHLQLVSTQFITSMWILWIIARPTDCEHDFPPNDPAADWSIFLIFFFQFDEKKNLEWVNEMRTHELNFFLFFPTFSENHHGNIIFFKCVWVRFSFYLTTSFGVSTCFTPHI